MELATTTCIVTHKLFKTQNKELHVHHFLNVTATVTASNTKLCITEPCIHRFV